MDGERTKFLFGDVPPESYEEDKDSMLFPEDLAIGSSYYFRFRCSPAAGMEYISDYPVQVADIHLLEGGVSVELVHLEMRDESWETGPLSVRFANTGLLELENTGPHRIKDWEEGTIDMGYLLPFSEAA